MPSDCAEYGGGGEETGAIGAWGGWPFSGGPPSAVTYRILGLVLMLFPFDGRREREILILYVVSWEIVLYLVRVFWRYIIEAGPGMKFCTLQIVVCNG
jgi:hypothetical protein